jgi:hypothetical protein
MANNNVIRDFSQVFNTYSVIDTDETNYGEAFKYLHVYNDVDCISFISTVNMIPSNLGAIRKDETGSFYINVKVGRDADIISKFELENKDNVKLQLMVSGKSVDVTHDTIIIPLMAIYTELYFRFTFVREPVEVKLTYKSYLLQNPLLRTRLMRQRVIASDVVYSDGVGLHRSMY